MDLQKELEELNRQIEADDAAALGIANDNAEKEEDTVPAVEESNAEEPKKEEEPQPEKAADTAVEAKKEEISIPEVKTTLEELPPEGGWAKLRWEAAEAKRKAAELEKKLAEAHAKPPVAKEENYEAYIESKIGMTEQELLEIKAELNQQRAEKEREKTLAQATDEFVEYEKQFKTQNSNVNDYEDATRHVVGTIAQSIRVLKPHLKGDEVIKETKLELLKRASIALNAGMNPAAALYKQAYSDFGYRPAAKQVTASTEKEEKKTPNLAKVAENRQRSAGMAGGGSGGSGTLTNDGLSQMTNAELAKLTPSDWERLERETA